MITLLDVIDTLPDHDEAAVIFLRRPWSPDAPVRLVAPRPEDPRLASARSELEALGYRQLTEVRAARAFVATLPEDTPLPQRCALLIRHVIEG